MYKLEPRKFRKYSPLPKGKEIYWTHLYSVYKTCIYWGYRDLDTLIAAILHDVVEDTKLTLNDITFKFGKKVANIVKLCTKKRTYKTFNLADQEEYFSNLYNHKDSGEKQSAMAIKLADRLDNLIGASFISDKGELRLYYKETKQYFSAIAKEIQKTEQLASALKYVTKLLED